MRTLVAVAALLLVMDVEADLQVRPQPARPAARADVNRRNPDGSTPLQWAVYNGDVAEARRLLRAGADVSLANKYGATPMSLAAEVGDTEMLKVLLEVGANVESPNADGQTALLAVARTGKVEAAKLLLDRGAKVDAKEKFGGQTPLMWASARRHPAMMQLLISKGADVNAASIDRDYQRHIQAEGRPKSLDSGGLTPLLYAARENCTACVDVLLKNKADIDLADPDGASPLLVAVMNANWDLARQLIEAGADVNQWDIFGEAPLYTAIDLRNRIDGGRNSIDAPNTATGLATLKLLLERGADQNMQLFFKPANVRGAIQTRGATPLIRAAHNADLEVVKLLLEHGADATLATGDRQTPIHAALAGRAAEPQAVELIKVLQKAGADVNLVALINHPEEIRGGTALHYAVRKRYKDVIKLLASFSIDMNAVDQDGLTALDYTQSRGFMPFMALQTPLFKDEAALLRELGATRLMTKSPVWPVLGPPQGVWTDIWPLGESQVHEPIYKPQITGSARKLPRRDFLSATALALGGSLLSPKPASAWQAAPRITTTDLGGATLLQGAGCNVIAMPGPDGALLIDGGRAANAEALLAAVRSATGSGRVHTLIDTHWHPEQIGANEAVGRAGGIIVAHEKTKTTLSNTVYSAVGITGRVAPLSKAGRPTRTVRSDGSMEFAGQQVDYGYMPAAHTDGDLFVHFPKMNLLVAGGVVSAEEWPLLDYKNGAWLGGRVRALERLAGLVTPDTRVVPAVGRVMTGVDIVRHRDMYQKLFTTMIGYLNMGLGPEDAAQRNPLKEYQAEIGDPSKFTYDALRSMMIAYVPD